MVKQQNENRKASKLEYDWQQPITVITTGIGEV